MSQEYIYSFNYGSVDTAFSGDKNCNKGKGNNDFACFIWTGPNVTVKGFSRLDINGLTWIDPYQKIRFKGNGKELQLGNIQRFPHENYAFGNNQTMSMKNGSTYSFTITGNDSRVTKFLVKFTLPEDQKTIREDTNDNTHYFTLI